MKLSRQEEIICVLWTIAALLAFSNNYNVFAGLFLGKAVANFFCAVMFSINEVKAEREDSSNG